MTKKKIQVYNADSIIVLEGLEGVRQKSAMYISDKESKGVFICVKEAVENAIDEVLAGHNNYISLIVNNKKNLQTFTIVDHGRGIPISKHKKSGKSTLTTILTTLHSGGKFNDTNYSNGSIGTHGVGISVTNALSSLFQIWTFRNKKWYHQKFKEGIVKSKVKNLKPPKLKVPLKPGTIIKFTPDYSIFGTFSKSKINNKVLQDWFKDLSNLNKGVKLRLIIDNKVDETYYNNKGAKNYLDSIIKDSACVTLGKPFIFESNNLTIAIQWSDFTEDGLFSYINGAKTIEHGEHVNGMNAAITKAFKTIVTSKKLKWTATDIRVGIIGYINYKFNGAEFNNQTKAKFVTLSARKEIQEQIYKSFLDYLKKNKTATTNILKRASEIKKAKDTAKALTKAASKLKSVGRSKLLLPGKLVTSSKSTLAEDKELFIVEGNSASGGAVKARDSNFQEILCMKGKIINSAKATLSKTLNSEEIKNIIIALGLDPSTIINKNKKHNFRVGKIMILSDADPDGPLVSNTKVLLVNGLKPTIKQLADNWNKDKKPFLVYSKDSNNKLKPALASNPRITTTAKEMVIITLTNSHNLKCDLNHKFVIYNPIKNDKRIIWRNNLPYVKAKDLTKKDKLNSSNLRQHVNTSHSIESVEIKTLKTKKDFYCLTVSKYHNFMIDDGFGNGILSANCHISQLILTALYILVPEVYKLGMVYVVDPPLFVASYKNDKWYSFSLKDIKKKCHKKAIITRLKGLAESTYQDLKSYGFDPKTRKAFKIKPVTKKQKTSFLKIVGEDSIKRKQILGIN